LPRCSTTAPWPKPRARAEGPPSPRTVGKPDDRGDHRAALDHGEREGWGLRLPPSVAEDPVWRTHWSGVESVKVKVRRDAIVVEPDELRGAPRSDRPKAKTKAESSAPQRELGRLKWFDEERGYGFIESPFGEDRFFRRVELLCDPAELEPGLPLEFRRVKGERGPLALGIRPLRLPPSA
jgi:CspA family cold shock protein